MAPAARHSAEQQQALIVDAAVQAIGQSSLLDFKMSDIAKLAGISMGSVYKHVQSKEDVLLALATEHLKHLRDCFSKINTLPLSTPERYIAINLIDKNKAGLYSFGSHLEMLITNDAILSKGSEIWKQRFYHADSEVDGECKSCLNMAIASGELTVPEQDTDYANKFILGLWAISVGFIHVSKQLRGKHLFGQLTPNSELLNADSLPIQTIKTYINAFAWQHPLTELGINNAINTLTTINLR
jgi:AcrR family transcriptional regulator